MRKWLVLACAVVAQSLVFLACGNSEGLDVPMIADCDGCAPALSGGGGGQFPDSSVFGDAGSDVTFEGSVVDVGVQANDVFGDTTGFVDVGVSGNDVFAP